MNNRNAKVKKRGSIQWVMAFVFVVLGFLLAYQYRQIQNPVRRLTIQETEELLHEIEMLKNEKVELIADNTRRQEELKTFESFAASADEANLLLKEELDHSRLLLGLADVKGSGLTISLKPSDSTLDPQNFSYLTDAELVYVVNELKYAGAEAVSINGKRISIQTGIKSSANNSFILINDEKVSPREEIVISAIGDQAKLTSAIAFHGAMSYGALEFYDIRFQPVDALIIEHYNKPLEAAHIEEVKAP